MRGVRTEDSIDWIDKTNGFKVNAATEGLGHVEGSMLGPKQVYTDNLDRIEILGEVKVFAEVFGPDFSGILKKQVHWQMLEQMQHNTQRWLQSPKMPAGIKIHVHKCCIVKLQEAGADKMVENKETWKKAR